MNVRNLPIVLVAGVALSACVLPEDRQPKDISEVVPEKASDPVAAAAATEPAGGPGAPSTVAMDQTFDVLWTCQWSDFPTTWHLPVIKVVGGEAFALNEWTRLDGHVVKAQAAEAAEDHVAEAYEGPRPDGRIRLTGQRKSEDGKWYDMTVAGPVYTDRPSVLHGYWKGAICTAQIDPIPTQGPASGEQQARTAPTAAEDRQDAMAAAPAEARVARAGAMQPGAGARAAPSGPASDGAVSVGRREVVGDPDNLLDGAGSSR